MLVMLVEAWYLRVWGIRTSAESEEKEHRKRDARVDRNGERTA